jgi:Toprim-like
MSRLPFSPAVKLYLEEHAVDLDLAHELGVRSDRDDILYPCTRPRGGSYTRRRSLTDGVTKGPKGEPLILWWPAGRPEPGSDVLLCEGEADALAALSALDGAAVAVAAIPGVNTPAERITADLAQAGSVTLALDGDKPGRDAADRIARALQGYTRLKVLHLEDGEDLASSLHGEEDRRRWLAQALEGAPEAPKLSTELETGDYRKGGQKKRPSQATQLVELAEGVELFHSPGSEAEAYARIPVGERHETWSVRARVFKDWLRRLFYEQTGSAPGSQAVTDALGVLEGQALFDGQELPVHVRLAELGGAFYLDLGGGADHLLGLGDHRRPAGSVPPPQGRRAAPSAGAGWVRQRSAPARECPGPRLGSFHRVAAWRA